MLKVLNESMSCGEAWIRMINNLRLFELQLKLQLHAFHLCVSNGLQFSYYLTVIFF